jgi:transposase
MNSHPPEEVEIAAWIGLDWADPQHEIRLLAVGTDQIESQVVAQQPEALQEWVLKLRLRFQGRPVAIALEQSRGALVYALMGYDFLRLYPVPPQCLAQYRKAFYPSGAKNDPVDAELLLEWLCRHQDRLRLWAPEDRLTRQLRLLVEYRRQVVDERTALTQQLTALLKNYFPQALEWAGDLATPQAWDFLWQWPSLAELQQVPREKLRQFYRQHGRPQPEELEQRLDQIQAAQPLTRDEAVISTAVLMVALWVSQLRCQAPVLAQLDQQIELAFAQHPDQSLFDILPGAGPVLAPRLLTAFGSDRTRFSQALDLQQFSGIAPVTERSGRSSWVHWRWGCPKFVRQSFHEFAGSSIPHSGWAQAYYRQRRARGCKHHAAVRALAYKWIRILYRCWQDRTPYNEALYLKALQPRGSPLVLVLAQVQSKQS